MRSVTATLAHVTFSIFAAIRSADLRATDAATCRGIRVREGINITPHNTERVRSFKDNVQYKNHQEANDESSFPRHTNQHFARAVLQPKELLS